MIGYLIALLVKRGVQSRFAAPLVYGGLILIIAGALLGVATCALHRHDTAHDTARENAILKKELPAVQKAAEQRSTDTTTIQQQKEEIRHVETAPPSGDGLSPRQRRGCVILRQQGARLADHPPCDRFKG